MAPKHDRCCCCIPLRFGVFLISLIAIIIGALNLWSGLRTGNEDNSSKISAYVSTAVYALLGLSGMLSVIFKTYAVAKNFSVLWWTVTIIVSILAIIKMILIGVSAKDDIRLLCQQALLTTDQYSSGNYDPATLSADVDTCYKAELLTSGLALAIQVVIMSLCGWVASRYTREVREEHEQSLQSEHYDPNTDKA
ncbi:hypothetical protein BGZ83_006724 [Gryganskiella cystojenkinii]|nr:hypothetical protein BGZ83_006724 [Gryganskiella cystojenkinii]